MMPLWYSPIYTDGLDPEARFPRLRYRIVREGLEAARVSGAICFHDPDPLPVEDLLLAHDSCYVEAFLSGKLDEAAMRRIGLRPWTENIVARTLKLTNGTVLATRHVLEHGGVSGNVGGGTHHAYRDFGSGYCIFNDLAVAARIAQRDHGVTRVLVLDLDVHQGDGTAAIFENDPSVRTVSFHCGKNFPFRKMNSDLDVPFPPETGDERFLETLERILQSEAGNPRPDLILFQAGVDAHQNDSLGFLKLTHDGLRARNSLVFDFASALGVPVVVTMGGGYGEPIEHSTRAHIDVFHQAAHHLDGGDATSGKTGKPATASAAPA
ncbi:MAG: histone deacetylase [Verrucomicrobiota bacterium]